MDTRNVYVNHPPSFDMSENSLPKQDMADETQSKNLSQESDYVEIDTIGSQNRKVKQEGTALGIMQNCIMSLYVFALANDINGIIVFFLDFIIRKRTETQAIYFFLALSILIAIVASVVACLALVKISSLSMV